MAASGGKTDVASQKAIASVDAITAQTDALDRARTVQNSINEGPQNSFTELFKSGELGIQGFADSMISALSSILADSSTKAFLSLFDGLGQGGTGGAGGGGWFGQPIDAVFGHSEGGYSDRPGVHSYMASMDSFRHAPHFAQGTPNTSGIPAVLHKNEAVIPLSRGRKVPVEMNGDVGGGGGQVVNVGDIIPNVTVEGGSSGDRAQDEAHAGRIASATVAQIQQMIDVRIAAAARYGGSLNPRAA